MRSGCLVLVFLAGCVEEQVIRRADPVPGIELTTVEADAMCSPMEAVEVQSGSQDPTTHELLRAFAAERGANYVVLDAFGVVSNPDDVLAVTRARLFRCPVTLMCYHRPPP